MRDDFLQETKETLAKRVGMKCSNPNCRKATSGPQEDPTKSINVGVAAHIKAASVGGKRYDHSMTPEERKEIKNGIWLCQNCSKLIDNDEMRYTVDLLFKWKKLSEDASLLEIENPTNSENQNVYITSINQSGGQNAQVIINEKLSKRDLSKVDQIIINELIKLPPETYHIQIDSGDNESHDLARQVDEILEKSGWKKDGFDTRLTGSLPPGIIFLVGQQDNSSFNKFFDLLGQLGGLKVSGGLEKDCVLLKIFIGSNPEKYRV